MPALRTIFMGTAELACASLNALVQWPGANMLAVVTQPDRPKGRQLNLEPSPVKVAALNSGLHVLQPQRARDEVFIASLRELEPDLIVVAAYGQILPTAILQLPRFGCLNVHTSLLPKHRGAAPIQWAILEGDAVTGVTIMKMDAGLDTGDIVSQEATPIHADDTAETLHDRLAEIGAALLVQTIPDFVSGKIVPRKQPAEGVSYARKIAKEDGRVDWTQPAQQIRNRLRAFRPWPGLFTFRKGDARLIKIWQADVLTESGEPGTVLRGDKSGITVACGKDALRITNLQRESGKRLSAQDFLAGNPLQPGDCFGNG
jgi:methionyl-tRNA formyltransferase